MSPRETIVPILRVASSEPGAPLAASQNRSHDAGVTEPVKDRDNPQRCFLRCAGNPVFTYKNEPQRSRAEVGALLALIGKRHEPAKASKTSGRTRSAAPRLRFGFPAGKSFLAVNGFHPAAFQIVIAAVEPVSGRRQFVEICGQRILEKFVSPASALRCQLVELLFNVKGEMHFQGLNLGKNLGCGKVHESFIRPLRFPVSPA
jgi:hypothetical protein